MIELAFHALLHDPDFRAIPDRHSQILFLRKVVPEQCFISINNKTLVEIDDVSLGNVKKIRCNACCRQQDAIHGLGHSPALTNDQEAEIVHPTVYSRRKPNYSTKLKRFTRRLWHLA
jgi:hypothetical protein